MPELPEVETTRRGIARHITGQAVAAVIVRQPRLRYPIPRRLAATLKGQHIRDVARRAKYLLLRCERGTLIIHLGMSGSLRVVACDSAPEKHDHVDLVLTDGRCLRYRDPRRFGAMLWTTRDPDEHPLLADLGPEPLSDEFTGAYLHRLARGRRCAVKGFIMDSRVVVGVGNIYANEALFRAGVLPRRAAGRVSLRRYDALAAAIKQVLADAVTAGGTTLRDFTNEAGKPGYFRHALRVYARAGEPCDVCGTPLRQATIGQRSTFYCPQCQT